MSYICRTETVIKVMPNYSNRLRPTAPAPTLLNIDICTCKTPGPGICVDNEGKQCSGCCHSSETCTPEGCVRKSMYIDVLYIYIKCHEQECYILRFQPCQLPYAGPSPKELQEKNARLELTAPPGCQMEAIGMEKHLGIV